MSRGRHRAPVCACCYYGMHPICGYPGSRNPPPCECDCPWSVKRRAKATAGTAAR